MSAILQKVRKFSLEYCDFPTMLLNVSMLLRVICINIDHNYKLGIPFYYYIITAVTVTCHFYVYMFSMTWFVFWRCTETGDLVAAMVVLSLGITSQIGNIKLIYMFLQTSKINKIADGYLSCDALVVPGSRFHINLQKTMRKVKIRAMMYWMVIVGNGVLYLLKPVILPGRNLPENHYVIYGLEPMFETPNYEIAYFMMIAGVFIICYVPANVTAYFIVIAGYTESQMLALSEEVLKVWPDALKQAEEEMSTDRAEENTKAVINKLVKRNLKEIIIRHALLIDLFDQVEHVFRGAVALGFVLLVLGLLAELLGKLENTYLQMPFAFVQVAMDCFTGQRVMDASVVFEQAVYECQWENFDRTNMKLVHVMMQNSQKIMSLSAGGMTMLSFNCFMSIAKGVYSAYAALRSAVNYK
ncbi:uncharacterized protein LOC142979627 [Anticarsia gemmatalis]|uniref:uncharacterized protein LOC142979627 n=1 Tax=Anticarsia gemmatalis TaxID=129554 RepID=UPI003F75AF64